jgi:hypothetical protein
MESILEGKGVKTLELSFRRTTQVIALLLLAAAFTQAVYTALLMSAFSGAALVQAERQRLAWSAITVAAILNVVQVGVGLTMFGPFFEAAGDIEALTPAARSVVAFSFMIYNAAKVLLALALIVIATAMLKAGSNLLGGAGAIIGAVALVSNAASMAAGRGVFGELPLAGASGVIATLVLAICIVTSKDAAGNRQ